MGSIGSALGSLSKRIAKLRSELEAT